MNLPRHTPPLRWEKLKPLARQMHHKPTPAEQVLWEALRGRASNGMKFRRQHAIDRFIVDFYCAEVNLIVEVDGSIHQYTQLEDKLRQEFLESLGLRVLRFSNDAVLKDLPSVLQQIQAVVTGRTC